jgi:hypothetical protein
MLVVIIGDYIPGYHNNDLYQLRVDSAVFETCIKKYCGPYRKKVVLFVDLVGALAINVHDPVVYCIVYHGAPMVNRLASMGYVFMGWPQGIIPCWNPHYNVPKKYTRFN